jgi:hypothetical protein
MHAAMFLLRPDDEMNALFEYCLAVAAIEYGIVVILACVLSNHHHTVVFDPLGNISEFCAYLHRLVANATNALRGRRENLWSSEALSLVRLVDADDVLAKLVYAATNPVKDGLVAKVEEWPGVKLSARSSKVGRSPTRPTYSSLPRDDAGNGDAHARALRRRGGGRRPRAPPRDVR